MSEALRQAELKTDLQLTALGVQNTLFPVIVEFVCRWGYSPSGIAVPHDFLIAEAVIDLFAFAPLLKGAGLGLLADGIGSLVRLPESLTSALRRFEWKHKIVVSLTALNVIPFMLLTYDTGGVRSSPFTPLLTVPALFTAFQARKPRAILLCMLIGLAAFTAATLAGSAAVPVETGARPVAVLVVSAVILGLAGFLSAGAKAKENKLSLGAVLAGAQTSLPALDEGSQNLGQDDADTGSERSRRPGLPDPSAP